MRVSCIVLLVSMMTLPSCANESSGFERTLVDAGNSGDCKAIGDVDGDGKPDLIVGGSTLVWYRNPDWRRFPIAKAGNEFTTDCQAKDLNGDGRLDLVAADGNDPNNVIWFENVGGGSNWTRHVIGSHGTWVHDIEVADFDGDGKLDVVTHGHGTHVWYQGPSGWFDVNVGAGDKTIEGIGIGDVDGDGHIDFVQGGWWFKNPGDRSDHWTGHQLASGYDGGSYTSAVGDLDGDGRPDIIVSEQHKRRELAWYAAPADPRRGDWVKHVLASDMGAHKLNIADVDGDGRPDLVVGLELVELRLYVNDGASPPKFTMKRINSTGCHNTRVGDVNGDGRPDILCVNFIAHPPVELWMNKPVTPKAGDRQR
ncbi:MAG: FG-GAP repeat domain-containing protein [Hyphomicrobiaceae bacterium]